MTCSAGTSASLALRYEARTSLSRASPSTPPSHFSSARSRPAAGMPMSFPADFRVLRSRRIATRMSCTESGSSRRIIGSSDYTMAACDRA